MGTEHLRTISAAEFLGPAEGQYTTILQDDLATPSGAGACFDSFGFTLTEPMSFEYEPSVPSFATATGSLLVQLWSVDQCAVVRSDTLTAPLTGMEIFIPDLPAGSYEILLSGDGTGMPWTYSIYIFTPEPLTGNGQLADELCGYIPGCND